MDSLVSQGLPGVGWVLLNREGTRGDGETVLVKRNPWPPDNADPIQLGSWSPFTCPARTGGAVPLSTSDSPFAQVCQSLTQDVSSYRGHFVSGSILRAVCLLDFHSSSAKGWLRRERTVRRSLKDPLRQWQLLLLVSSSGSLWELVCGELPGHQWKNPLQNVWEAEGRQAGVEGR